MMQGRAKKLKGQDGNYILPVTHADLVYVDTDKTLTEKLGEINTSESSVKQEVSGLSTKKPTVVFILDDTSKFYYDNLSVFINRGAKFTTAFRQDYIGSAGGGLTFELLREMQSQGIEIAYHGLRHNYTKDEYNTDIPDYLARAVTEKIEVGGFVGPNGDFYEDIVFHTFFEKFKWARGGGTNGVANVGSPVDYFKLIPAHFIDDLTSDAALTTLKTKIDNLGSKGTGVLALSTHLTAQILPYLTALLDYIISKGIVITTAADAYETYGAIYEYYDNTLTLGGDFEKRGSGNGGTSNNPASAHFILQKDGTVISNMAAKLIKPKHKGTTINGNTLPDAFDVGISITQYGSIDDRSGFPNIGTLYNFNLGKDNGQQFQLYKCHNIGGVYYREANTNNTWQSGMVNKLGVFRSTVPASATSSGFKGDFSADVNYLYICYADNNWIRIAKDTW